MGHILHHVIHCNERLDACSWPRLGKCGEGGYAADDRLGVEGRYSTGAERLACLAAASWSYHISSDRLDEL
ncbi:MAG: hypothetical protein GY903_22845, partial [Fuerstiella sp.]|nr:hypothetical protein [Fuerstiella sp.]